MKPAREPPAMIPTTADPAPPDWLPPWPPQNPAIARSVSEAMRAGDWGRYDSAIGDQCRNELSQMHGGRDVRWMPSGSAAIEWALRIAGLDANFRSQASSDSRRSFDSRPSAKPRIAASSLDYPGVIRGIECVGGRPVLIDTLRTSPTIDIDALLAAARDDRFGPLDAVIVTHLWGHGVDIDRLRRAFAGDPQPPIIIEDACQSPGMLIKGQRAGTLGDIATLSFGGSKPLTCGTGGALLINSARHVAAADRWLNRPSVSQTMSPLALAALRPQLDTLSRDNDTRLDNVHRLIVAIPDYVVWRPVNDHVPNVVDDVRVNAGDNPGAASTFYKLPLGFPDRTRRDEAITRAARIGVPLGVPFRSASRMSPRRCDRVGDLRHADRWSETLALLDHRVLLTPPESAPRMVAAVRWCVSGEPDRA